MPVDRTKEIFLEALEHQGAARQKYVHDACSSDSTLRRRVEKLLQAHDRAADFMSEPTEGGQTLDVQATGPGSGADGEGPGSMLGRYHLVQRIGEGGFGTVYLAEQQHPVVRQVALKIIKPGMDTRQIITRFEAERQALAMMDHPCIARVFDAGATALGRPFFVMEYVRGEPITAYCQRRKLTLRQRLELFEQVCMAVQHAHQKGIIHRDIKPSNVLVTVVDGRPVPKVIDFGIAKATAGENVHATQITAQHQVVGTPQYMAPEQASIGGEDVDTRADVYSLGVLLYELLTGLLPFEPARLRSVSLGELERIIREEELPKPTVRLRTLGSGTSGGAASRGTDTARLAREISGDLEWIIMRALEKDRARRYATAYALAADIRRHLDGEPVEAGPPSRRYRMGKFVRRHRLVLVAATTMFASLLAVAVFSLIFATRARRAERSASNEADRARTELAKYEAVADFSASILTAIDPAIARGSDRTLIRKILESAVERAGTELADQPEVEAATRTTLGYAYFTIGDYEAAEQQFKRVLRVTRKTFGEDHPDTLQAASSLVGVLVGQSHYQQALVVLDDLIPRMMKILGLTHPSTLTALEHLAMIQNALGHYELACRSHERVLAARAQIFGPLHEDTLATMNSLATAHDDLGQHDRAIELRHRVFECQKVLLGMNHPHTLATMSNLAGDYGSAGATQEAEELLIQALAIKQSVLDDDHPSTITTMGNLASLYLTLDRLHESEILYREALASARHALGEDHHNTLIVMFNLGRLYRQMGRASDAEPLVRTAFEGMLEKFGPQHPQTLQVAVGHARVTLDIGRPDEAIRLCLSIKDAVANRLGRDAYADLLYTLGKAHSELGNLAEAEANLLEAYGFFDGKSDYQKRARRCIEALAGICDGLGRPADAAQWRAKLDAAPPASE